MSTHSSSGNFMARRFSKSICVGVVDPLLPHVRCRISQNLCHNETISSTDVTVVERNLSIGGAGQGLWCTFSTLQHAWYETIRKRSIPAACQPLPFPNCCLSSPYPPPRVPAVYIYLASSPPSLTEFSSLLSLAPLPSSPPSSHFFKQS